MSIFATRLKTAMQQANLTSAQLSKQTGIGRSSISQWLSSKYVAKHDKVTVLAAALAVTPDWLLGVTETATATVPTSPAPTVDAELVAAWQALDAENQQKLLKKAHKLIAKQTQPVTKDKKKRKKKKAKKK